MAPDSPARPASATGSAPHEEAAARAPVVALCGGVGAARFLRGLVRCVPGEDVVAIVNTGDDREFYGVHVSPDVDIVTYTLAGVVNGDLGYGLAGDSHLLMDRLAALGHDVWFRLGDRDFANCLHRTLRLREGRGLGEITRQLAADLGVATRILPMSEDPCPTLVEIADDSGGEGPPGRRKLHFEEYLIRERSPDRVIGVDLAAASRATPAPGVLEAVTRARTILICPSNPVVSIGPILAVPAIGAALARTRAPIVGISPVVGGAPIKGPAAQLLRGIGVEVSPSGVARHYTRAIGRAARPGPGIDGFVCDVRDEDQLPAIRDLGLAAVATDSLMISTAVAAELAATALELAEKCRA